MKENKNRNFFEVHLVNYDENNVPCPVKTLVCASPRELTKEELEEFCHETLNLDFEAIFRIEKVTEEEAHEYYDEENELIVVL